MRPTDDDAALLEIRVSYAGAPDARQIGTLIERTGNAFAQFTRAAGVTEHLTVDQLHIGSFVGWLKIAGTASAVATLIEQRGVLASFLEQLAIAIELATEGQGLKVAAYIRSLLVAAAKPVASGVAQDARFSIVGDNNAIVVIARDEAQSLLAKLDQQFRLVEDSGAVKRATVPEVRIARLVPNEPSGWSAKLTGVARRMPIVRNTPRGFDIDMLRRDLPYEVSGYIRRIRRVNHFVLIETPRPLRD